LGSEGKRYFNVGFCKKEREKKKTVKNKISITRAQFRKIKMLYIMHLKTVMLLLLLTYSLDISLLSDKLDVALSNVANNAPAEHPYGILISLVSPPS
jgi:hypothetical protein